MKHIFIVLTLIATSIGMLAQPPQGGGRPSGMGGQRPPMNGQMQERISDSNNEYWIMHFPEIPELTSDNKRKIIDLLCKEKKETSKFLREKMDLEDQIFNTISPSEKDMDKFSKKISKLEAQIEKISAKYNTKYSKILTVDQYLVFKEKRKDIKFKKPRETRSNIMSPDRDEPGNRPDGNMPPNMPMFDGPPD